MLETNPFSLLSEVVPTVVMQGFIIAMVLLIAFGTIIQMIHHKNLTYFFNNAKKAKLQATREVGAAEKAKIIAKTTVYDIGTTSELGFGKRRFQSTRFQYRHKCWKSCRSVNYALSCSFNPKKRRGCRESARRC